MNTQAGSPPTRSGALLPRVKRARVALVVLSSSLTMLSSLWSRPGCASCEQGHSQGAAHPLPSRAE